MAGYNFLGRFNGFPKLINIPNYSGEQEKYNFNNNKRVLDIGKYVNSYPYIIHDCFTFYLSVLRTEVPPQINGFGTNNVIFVPKDSIDAYKNAEYWNKGSYQPIGGEEWIKRNKELANKYAAEYSNWTEEQIASANYADEYIDYDIFGVPRPE